VTTQVLDKPALIMDPHQPTRVMRIFPSADLLPENLLRFYVSFSNPMQRGWAEQQIALLDSDGRPALDTLYRPPVELWDGSMRHLTILLDPGRLKRRVGPNRELGSPLVQGERYTLAIGPRMVDFVGRPLGESFHKSFEVTEPVREHISVESWKVNAPSANERQPITLVFPRPLDWALLWHSIRIDSENGQRVEGRFAIDQHEKRWSFTPASPWPSGSYRVRIATSLEDVCGNNLLVAFDGPIRSTGDLSHQDVYRFLRFDLA
jgi:hypothetical protein